ncbi:MAG: EpsI family protein [Candidatus Omnitrophica bacterium]|nr:EpsI family protein [Candidatus Omnitrophota bacterium]
MRKRQWLAMSAALGLMAITVGFLFWLKTHQRLGAPGLKLDLPERVLDYTSALVEISREELAALPADTTFGRRIYSRVRGGQTNEMLLSIVLMGTDRTSLHKPQFCLVGQGWRIEKTEKVAVRIERPHAYDLPVMRMTASKQFQTGGGQGMLLRGIYAYWFVSEHQLTAEHWKRMWWMAKNLLFTGVLQRWAYVSCFGTCLPGQEEKEFEEMRRFLAAAVPEFQFATRPALTLQNKGVRATDTAGISSDSAAGYPRNTFAGKPD